MVLLNCNSLSNSLRIRDLRNVFRSGNLGAWIHGNMEVKSDGKIIARKTARDYKWKGGKSRYVGKKGTDRNKRSRNGNPFWKGTVIEGSFENMEIHNSKQSRSDYNVTMQIYKIPENIS